MVSLLSHRCLLLRILRAYCSSFASSEFLVFRCSNLFLPLSLLGIALARQVLSLFQFPSLTLPPFLGGGAPLHPLHSPPLPLPFLQNAPLFLDALHSFPLGALLAFALVL